MNEKLNRTEDTESMQERLDKIIEEKLEQTSALKKLLEELQKDEEKYSSEKK